MAMHMQSLQRKKAAALEARLKNADDPLTKNLRAAGPEHLREAPPEKREAADKDRTIADQQREIDELKRKLAAKEATGNGS